MVVILDWYKYLFYRVYKWRCSRGKTPISDPDVDAVFLITLANALFILGFLAIIIAFSKTLQYVFFNDFGKTKLILFGTAIMFFILHLYLYIWSGGSKKIIKSFDKSARPSSKLGTIAVVFYMIFCYFFFVFAGILLVPSIRVHLP